MPAVIIVPARLRGQGAWRPASEGGWGAAGHPTSPRATNSSGVTPRRIATGGKRSR